MANFVPYWYPTVTKNTINEGESQNFIVQVKKNDSTDTVNTYNVEHNQYIEINFTFTVAGTTMTEKDILVTAGEKLSTLDPIESVDSTYNAKTGSFSVKLNKNIIYLESSTSASMYFVKVNMLQDGVWDGPESVSFNLNYVHIVTQDTAGNITAIQDSGVVDKSTSTIEYTAENEFWITPGTEVYGTKNSLIGSLNYGSESRIFVQAYGSSRAYDSSLDLGRFPDDQSNRVFVPAYNIVFNSSAYMPTTHITGNGTVLLPLGGSAREEVPIMIRDTTTGQDVRTGLSFLCNGQIVQTCVYDSEPIDAYIRVQIVDISTLWESDADMFYEGKRFKAYQMWVAPTDLSNFYIQDKIKPGHLYMLKDTTVYPYVIKTERDLEGNSRLVFEESVWLDLGVYEPSLGTNIIGQTRVFRIVLNNNENDDIYFETEADLGEMRSGEYFGHTQDTIIVAKGDDLITYTVSEDDEAMLRKYGIRLCADGYLAGTVYAKGEDYDANDHIVLNFTVIATSRKGRSVQKIFTLTIVRGFGPNFMSAYAVPSKVLERRWFEMISTPTFSAAKFYRPSDERFGLKRLPKILIKENLLDSTKKWTSLSDAKSALRANIISNNPTPEGPFTLSLGNYKIRSAIDNNGNVMYDVLYIEVLPTGYKSVASIDPYSYSSSNSLVELYGLRENLYQTLGEDTYNIELDPQDYKNRAITVPGISGLNTTMIDTVPRHMVHPYTENGAVAEFLFMLPVAYLEPGAGETLYTNLVQANEHLSLINVEFDVQSVNFVCYNSKSSTDVNAMDSFGINLIKRT